MGEVYLFIYFIETYQIFHSYFFIIFDWLISEIFLMEIKSRAFVHKFVYTSVL